MKTLGELTNERWALRKDVRAATEEFLADPSAANVAHLERATRAYQEAHQAVLDARERDLG